MITNFYKLKNKWRQNNTIEVKRLICNWFFCFCITKVHYVIGKQMSVLVKIKRKGKISEFVIFLFY